MKIYLYEPHEELIRASLNTSETKPDSVIVAMDSPQESAHELSIVHVPDDVT